MGDRGGVGLAVAVGDVVVVIGEVNPVVLSTIEKDGVVEGGGQSRWRGGGRY